MNFYGYGKLDSFNIDHEIPYMEYIYILIDLALDYLFHSFKKRERDDLFQNCDLLFCFLYNWIFLHYVWLSWSPTIFLKVSMQPVEVKGGKEQGLESEVRIKLTSLFCVIFPMFIEHCTCLHISLWVLVDKSVWLNKRQSEIESRKWYANQFSLYWRDIVLCFNNALMICL